MSHSDLRAAAFLDRDGTVIEEREYLADPEEVSLVPGAAGAIRDLREAGFVIVVVTNQSGIARGLYSERDYQRVAARVDAVLDASGARPDATFYCPHHPDHTGPCACRKPGTGMHERAAAALHIDLTRSIYVGDKISDLVPGLELGGRAILVRTGFGREAEPDLPAGAQVVNTISDVPALITGGSGD